jgi:hypothetical protein
MGKLNTVQNGKGDKSRISSLAKYEDGYDAIDWGRGDNRTFKDAKKRFVGGGPVVASGEDIAPMIYGDSVFPKEIIDQYVREHPEGLNEINHAPMKDCVTVIGEGKTVNGKHYIQMTKDGATYTAIDGDKNMYVDIAQSTEPPRFANMIVDNNGQLIPASWSVCNLPPEEFNNPYTITTCDGNGRVEVREVNKGSPITH